MAFIPTSSAAKLEVRALQELQQVENVFWFVKNAFAASDLAALTAAIAAYWASAFLPLLSNTYSLKEVYARGMRTASDIDSTDIGEAGETGERTGQPLPLNDSLCFTIKTGFTGRANRGRHYPVGITEDLTNGSIVDPAWILSYATALAGIGTTADSLGWDWVLVSQYSGVDSNGKPIPRAAGVAKLVTAITKDDNVVDSQRRRLPGRGR